MDHKYNRIKYLQQKYEVNSRIPKKYYRRKQELRDLETVMSLTKQEKDDILRILFSIDNLKALHRKASLTQLVVIICFTIKKQYNPKYTNKTVLKKYDVSDAMLLHVTRQLFYYYISKNTNPYFDPLDKY